MKQYNIVLIGCGHMGAAHMDNIYFMEQVNVFAVVDLDETKARLFQKKYNATHVFNDYREAVSAPETDIVIIATYPSSHLEILKECLRYKKHVLCEKPIASDLAEAEEFASLCKDAESKVLIGYILRHNKTYQYVRDLIHRGEIGFPVVMRMVQNHHTKDWKKYLALIEETSPIVDCGVHYVDVMSWFTGAKVVSVSGVGARTEPDVPKGCYNYGIITARLSDGSVAFYEAGWSNTMSSDNLKEFVGPKGSVKIIYRDNRNTHQEEGDLVEIYRYPEKKYDIVNIDCQRKPTGSQLLYLIRMIEEGAPPIPSMDEVLEGFRVVCEADEHIRKQIAEAD